MHPHRRREHAAESNRRRVAHGADAQCPGHLAGKAGGGVAELIGGRQRFARPRQQLLPGVRQHHAARSPFKQFQVEQRLQGLDLAAQGGLADVQALGRPGQVAALSHRDKGSDLVQLHGHLPLRDHRNRFFAMRQLSG